MIGGRAGLHPRSPVRVVERETFPDAWQRVVVHAERPVGIDPFAECGHLGIGKKLSQHGPATVRRTASQPAVADAVAVDAELRRRDRVLAVDLQHQCAAK